MGRAQDRGRAAEHLAAAYLECLGCRILERNIRLEGVEVDLVVADGAVTAIVEVRMRSRDDFGGAAASVDRRKQARLRQAALALVARGIAHPRVDVVAIDLEPHGARLTRWCNVVTD